MKKWLAYCLFLILVISLSACSTSAENKTIKIGINDSDRAIWDFIAGKAEEEGQQIEMIEFSDYGESNMALANGEIDANAFQTISYFQAFTKKYKDKLAPLGTTYIAGMGIYSKTYKRIKDIPNGAVVALPDEGIDLGRALMLLQEAGLLKLKKGFNGNGSMDMIKDNSRHLKIKTVSKEEAYRRLDDVDVTVLTMEDAEKAGLHPEKDALQRAEQTAEVYMNMIAVRAEDRDRENLENILELYHSDDTAAFIEKEYHGNLIPAFLPLKSLSDWKNEFTQ
ncbi:MetQ/NlpA family ABC transporter substrate-binding protein [Bacillus atrophaeus]|uniref:MetQ/NlpA family ABC transporter substrate-binding protein n=1 Tax=Bacillus atrophaeus TaxID=1452 RepID=UPI0022809648|nr:MetQ/NlpA family ABC transporter substrate-binding protein [Bacillus atrophaeus]MCY8486559.1 MetQ/NlpA family ABC transporter substrate-binding protein [Bacillus atrophaeus]